MRVRHGGIGARPRRPDDGDALIRGFVHRAFRGANHVGPLVDGAAVRHRVDLRPAFSDQPDAHAIAGEPRGRRGRERRRRAEKTIVLERARHEFQRRLETQARALVALQVDAQRRNAVYEHLEPAGAPLQLAQQRRHVDSIARGDVQRDDAVQPAVYLNRETHVDAVLDDARSRHLARATQHQAAPLRERSLGDLREVLDRLPFGPHRDGDEAAGPRGAGHDQARADSGDHLALQGEPAPVELLRGARRDELLPGGTDSVGGRCANCHLELIDCASRRA